MQFIDKIISFPLVKMGKKLPIEPPTADPELEALLEKMKSEAIVEATPPKRQVSEKQKAHLDTIRAKSVKAKQTNKQKLEYLQKYYIESEKSKVNKEHEKKVYAARKAREQAKKAGKVMMQFDEDEHEEEQEEEELEEEEVVSEEGEEEYESAIRKNTPLPPKRKAPGTTTKKKYPVTQHSPAPVRGQQKQQATRNPFSNILG